VAVTKKVMFKRTSISRSLLDTAKLIESMRTGMIDPSAVGQRDYQQTERNRIRNIVRRTASAWSDTRVLFPVSKRRKVCTLAAFGASESRTDIDFYSRQ
jgi:hypothetical protein